MRSILNNWAKLAFILVPLLIVLIDAAVLFSEQFQTESAKAIRIVKESRSRKENFTVQQYFYTTVYHRKSKGEAIEIEGWRARQPSDPNAPVAIEFSYADESGRHVATWNVFLEGRHVMPSNELAEALSWR